MPCILQPNPYANLTSITWLVLHLLTACLSLPWSSLFTFSCIFVFSFFLQLHTSCSTPSLPCFYSFYHVSLACLCLASLYLMLLCSALPLRILSCAFLNTLWLVLHLQLVHSNLIFTYKSHAFDSSFLFQLWILYRSYVLHLKSVIEQTYTLQCIMYLLFLQVSYAMHLSRALNPMSWEFLSLQVWSL